MEEEPDAPLAYVDPSVAAAVDYACRIVLEFFGAVPSVRPPHFDALPWASSTGPCSGTQLCLTPANCLTALNSYACTAGLDDLHIVTPLQWERAP